MGSRIFIVRTENIPKEGLTLERLCEDKEYVIQKITYGEVFKLYTKNELLGFKNELTLKLRNEEDKNFIVYCFNYVESFIDKIEESTLKLTNNMKTRLLTDTFFVGHELDDYTSGKDLVDTKQFLEDIKAEMFLMEISDCSIAVGTTVKYRVNKVLKDRFEVVKDIKKNIDGALYSSFLDELKKLMFEVSTDELYTHDFVVNEQRGALQNYNELYTHSCEIIDKFCRDKITEINTKSENAKEHKESLRELRIKTEKLGNDLKSVYSGILSLRDKLIKRYNDIDEGEVNRVIDISMMNMLQDELFNDTRTYSKRVEYEQKGCTRITTFLPFCGRYRISLGNQRGSLSISMRFIPSKIRPLSDFRLPKRVENRFLDGKGGLFLIVGTPNSGKSTLASAVINDYARTKPIKICTAERPIEYLFKHQKGLVTQHEIGEDIRSYNDLREMLLTYDPDVIYLTEIKNIDELKNAVEMAESGITVVSTFHAGNTEEALIRVKGMLADDQLAIVGFSTVLRLILTQKLVKRKSGGVIPTQEIFNVTPNIKTALAEFKMSSLTNDLMNQKVGNRKLENDMWNLLKSGEISEETFRSEVNLDKFNSITPVLYNRALDDLDEVIK